VTDQGGVDRRGIEIPAEIADAARIPDDLDANVLGEYAVPDTRRRRQTGLVYGVAAVVSAGAALVGISAGFWLLAAVFVGIGGYHIAAGKRLEIREDRALELANRATTFAVGHASAALGFDGVLARPVWNVLVFSADEPPTERGLVRVDALTGSIVDQYVEKIEP
jgi:hypothetical protein